LRSRRLVNGRWLNRKRRFSNQHLKHDKLQRYVQYRFCKCTILHCDRRKRDELVVCRNEHRQQIYVYVGGCDGNEFNYRLHLYRALVSRPGDFVNADSLLGVRISPAERSC
jgi:hypothetical protein